jgi:hypothetical protein
VRFAAFNRRPVLWSLLTSGHDFTRLTMFHDFKQNCSAGSLCSHSFSRVGLLRLGSALVGLACVMNSLTANSASPGSLDPKSALAPMTYEQMVKAMAAEQQTDKMRARLAGKSVRLKLKKAGPNALVVAVGDGISFFCEQRAQAFKGGAVTSQITDVADTAEGNFMVSLRRCE